MLDIIIPAYNAHDTILNTLYSIAYQEFSSFINVTIVDDCSDVNYNEEIDFFSKFIKIKQIRLDKNSGPGVARQVGLDNTNGVYVMFIDADDILFNCFSIRCIISNMMSKNCDVLCSNFVEEFNGHLSVTPNSLIWLHGKCFKKSFLVKYNIKFNDSRSNEDLGFLKLIKICRANINYVDEITYIYCYNSKSLTRNKCNKYEYESIKWMSYNVNWAVNEGIRRNGDKKIISEVVYSTLVSLFYNYLLFNMDNNILKWSKNLYNFYRNNKYVSEEALFSSYDKYVAGRLTELSMKNNITIDDFFYKLEGVL